MALTRALGNANTPAPESLPLDGLSLRDIDPRVETAMFGTVADLQRLLDQGLRPNATARRTHPERLFRTAVASAVRPFDPA